MIIRSLSPSSKKNRKINLLSAEKLHKSVEKPKWKQTLQVIENKLQKSKSYQFKETTITTTVSPKRMQKRAPILTPTSKKLPSFFSKRKQKREQEISNRIFNLNNGLQKCLKQLELRKFQIINKLGHGINGDVMLAKVRSLCFLVALKTFKKRSIKLRPFIEQVKIQSYLDHPNIVKLYAIWNDKENVYLVLQTCSHNLFRQIKVERGFSQDKTRGYIKQVLEALNYLHDHQIIHRDIKPQNILNCNGVLKLCDFGWSVYTGRPNQGCEEGMRKTFCGTFDYVSPEVSQGYHYNEQIDAWSVGILTYEMMTGNVPFKQKLIVEKEPIYFNENFSPKMKIFIKKLLEFEPRRRMTVKQALQHDWIIEQDKKQNPCLLNYQEQKLISDRLY